MSFKIVQTIEKGQCVLSTVPESWESNGILRWPKSKADILRRDPGSKPQDCWRSINCILKRQKYCSFLAAENEIKLMSDVSDTDQDQERERRISKQPSCAPVSYNDLARKYMETQVHTKTLAKDSNLVSNMETDISEFLILQEDGMKGLESPNKTKTPASDTNLAVNTGSEICEYLVVQQTEGRIEVESSNKTYPEPEQQQEFILDTSCVNNNEANSNLNNVLAIKVENLTNISNALLQQQTVLSENQELIMLKLSEISAQFDELVKRLPNTHTENIKKHVGTTKLIANQVNLDELEDSLKNSHTAGEMIKLYSVVCGEGKGRAVNNAYALIDAMFDREFLMKCSWAGGSRSDSSKICFKSYKRIINLFFQVVHQSDKQFTMQECQTFLQNVLRNSKKRCNAKMAKKSCQKRRAKKEPDNGLQLLNAEHEPKAGVSGEIGPVNQSYQSVSVPSTELTNQKTSYHETEV